MISTDLQTTNSRQHGRSVRAFTLPELVVSVAVSGLLVASLGSALSIAARSIRPDATAAASLDATRCVQIIQNDLQFATRILDQSPRSIKVLTTDADRNGSQDVVQYTWSGTAGTALTRSANGSTAVSVCDSVSNFSLALTTSSESLVIPEPPIPGSELLLDEQTSLTGTSAVTVGWSDACAEYVTPSTFLNTGLITANDEWQITRVDYYAQRTDNNDGAYEFEIDRATADGLPCHDELVSIELDTLEISNSGGWVSHTLSDMPWLGATDGVTLKLSYLWGWNGIEVRRTAAGTGDGFQITDSSSTDWMRPATNRSLLFRVYGRKRSQLHLDQSEPCRRFTSAGITLATSLLPSGPLNAAVELVNRPVDATFLASTDFAAFSLTGDSNYDGSTDWTLSNISSSNSSTVSAGKWTAANKTLRLTPSITAGRIVDSHTVCRCTSTSATVIVRSAVQQSTSSQSVSIMAYLTLSSAGTQTLSIYEETATDVFTLRKQFPLLASTLQDVRLVLNPGERTAAVWVNNVLMDTFWLGLITTPGVPARVQVQAWGSGCEFDLCSVVTRASSGFGVGTP